MTHFGTTADGRYVARITLEAGDLKVAILTLGAALHEVRLAGVDYNLTAGTDDVLAYAGDWRYHGTIIGPIANRISTAQVKIEGMMHELDSNGGMMAYGLANYKSNLVAAVASVSGVMLECTGSTSHPMPVVHLHGTSDGVLPYNGSSDWNSAQSTLDYWINFNNTITTPTVSIDNSGGMSIEHYVYDQGDSSVSVEHYKFIGGDHVWFSATYQGQDASELVWNFVSRYDINGLR